MNLETTRLRGRPRKRWQDEMREDGWIVGGEGWQEKVHNRGDWKKLLRMARNHWILHMPVEWMITTQNLTLLEDMASVSIWADTNPTKPILERKFRCFFLETFNGNDLELQRQVWSYRHREEVERRYVVRWKRTVEILGSCDRASLL